MSFESANFITFIESLTPEVQQSIIEFTLQKARESESHDTIEKNVITKFIKHTFNK